MNDENVKDDSENLNLLSSFHSNTWLMTTIFGKESQNNEIVEITWTILKNILEFYHHDFQRSQHLLDAKKAKKAKKIYFLYFKNV